MPKGRSRLLVTAENKQYPTGVPENITVHPEIPGGHLAGD